MLFFVIKIFIPRQTSSPIMYSFTIATLLASLAVAKCRSDLVKPKLIPVVTECYLNLNKTDDAAIATSSLEEKMKIEEERVKSSDAK